MIKIENAEVYGWEAAIRGARNPMNSWAKSDSKYCEYEFSPLCDGCGCLIGDECMHKGYNGLYRFGENDLTLMKKLVAAGPDHAKFMRMLSITVDVTAPLYWWSQYDTYKVGTVANSCSKMHKIHAKEFELEDFSYDYLTTPKDDISDWAEVDTMLDFSIDISSIEILEHIVQALNHYRNLYLETQNKKYWWQLIQLLPSSYNQKRTVQLNYAVARNMYHARKEHKLDEWKDLCFWFEHLPYSELITG